MLCDGLREVGIPELGIVGAGISTIIASFFACLLFFLFYLKENIALNSLL